MTILFYDGNIKYLTYNKLDKDGKFNISNYFVVDAGEGFSHCEQTMQDLYDKNYKGAIITNHIGALSHSYGWDKENDKSDCWIWQEDKQGFMNIDDIWGGKTRISQNIRAMYTSGALKREGQFLTKGGNL